MLFSPPRRSAPLTVRSATLRVAPPRIKAEKAPCAVKTASRFPVWMQRAWRFRIASVLAMVATDPESTADLGPRLPDGTLVADIDVADLVTEHADAVFRVAMSVTRDTALAEDVSQDALIKAWQALPSYRGEAPLRNWILRITHNTAVSALRRRREELRDPSELPERVSFTSVESIVADHIAYEKFSEALGELDELSRSIVALREIQGLSYDEICEILDLPLPTVKTRLLRARRQLAKALEGWRP